MAKRGRPTKYKPEMCDQIIELGKQGASKHEMAAEIGIRFSTWNNWEHSNPIFMEAVSEALAQSQAWWEKNGRIATFGGYDGFNATSYIFQMKNRFSNDWRDKRETQYEGGLTVNIPGYAGDL